MIIYIARLGKTDLTAIHYYKYKGWKKIVVFALWAELLEEHYLQNPSFFLTTFQQYLPIQAQLIHDHKLQIKTILQAIAPYNKNNFEAFLEKIHLNKFRFIVFVR